MTPAFPAELVMVPDAPSLAAHVADWLLLLALEKQGRFAVCLSGGSTPKRLYELLAGPVYRDRFPWSRVQWFWGDERFVPAGDTMSNFHMVNEAMLSHAPVPPAHIHPIPTEKIAPDASAAAYEHTLQLFYDGEQLNSARPLFDVVLLGLGADGHTASLFPGSAALQERKRWACAVVGTKPPARITLTYPALESCRHMAFLVSGREKLAILARLRSGDAGLPAARVRPHGRLIIFADSAAAGVGS